MFLTQIIAEIGASPRAGAGSTDQVRRLNLLIALAALALLPAVHAHEVPSDVTVRMLVRPEGDRVVLLVRAPLEAMQDIVFPTFGPGYLDVPRAAPQLRSAAQVWLLDNLELYEGERRLPLSIVAVRASLPSDRAFAEFDTALARFNAEPLAPGLDLPWQQALLDVQLEAPIESESSLFSLRAHTERLGRRVVNAVRFLGASGVERVFQLEGDAGVVPLDPRWHQSMLRFLVQGFEHILGGADHLLFLLCLIVPFRRQLRALVWIVTAFTAGHSVTLIAAAYGAAPTGLWFPPLVETLIALSIFYMCVENVVCPNPRTRWPIAFGFGLVHGFGFSFALQNTLQFAGDHVLMSLLSFNVGIELGQLLVLVVLVPALNLLFRYVDARVGGIVIAVIVGHTAWHWLAERFVVLQAFLSWLPWMN